MSKVLRAIGKAGALLFALPLLVQGQLPPSGTLSDADWPLFHAEIARLEKVLNSTPDQATITYELAQTWAAGKQWPQTIEWLRRVADRRAGLDPSRNSAFAPLYDTREFHDIMSTVLEATAPVSHSTVAFSISEADLVPESVAFDKALRRFYFGSMKKGKVVRCLPSGECSDFVKGLGVVLGLKVHGSELWVLNNSPAEASLMRYDLQSAHLIRSYSVEGAGHAFNDLTVAANGEAYLTDTPAKAIWHLSNLSAELERIDGEFRLANGIARSPDGGLLFVSTYPDGLSIVDLRTGNSRPLERPPGLCLATIDGLYFYRGALIAIQNALMSPRVVRLVLSRDLRRIARYEVLERRNALFDGVTTGAIAGHEFFYMANIQDGKTSGFDPIRILRLRL